MFAQVKPGSNHPDIAVVTPEHQPQLSVDITDPEFKELLTKIYDSTSGITFDQFISSLVHEPKKQVEQIDSTRPFNHYFISSSHNTYLTGRSQLSGKASIEGYVNALLRGCRCLEIDVWNGANGQPKVVHGWTLVEPIHFRDVCKAIAENVFKSSPFPLLVSLESHCDYEQQGTMVDIMLEEFGDMLVDKPLNPLRTLPSLDDLKYKILIMVSIGKDSGSSSPPDNAETVRGEQEVKKVIPKDINPRLGNLGIYAVPRPFENLYHKFSLEFNHIHNVSERMFSKMENKPLLADSSDNVSGQPMREVTSITSEIHNEQLTPRGVVLHNALYLMRIYPNGYRFNSSNPFAPVYWAYGAQIVALNWQKVDKSNMLNQALFEGTGGYVLKPGGQVRDSTTTRASLGVQMRQLADKMKESLNINGGFHEQIRDKIGKRQSHASDSMTNQPTPRKRTGKLRVELLGAQNLPLPANGDVEELVDFRPYAKVQLIAASVPEKYLDEPGIPSSGKVVKQSTHWTKTLNGPSPIWNAAWVYDITSELAFIRIKFFHNDGILAQNDPSAWWACRIGNHKEGYTIVHPYAMNGTVADPSIVALLKFTWL
ncbi:PLC-like phosphodiesterase [Lipomyces tetrasporus]|uniref:Phosphoinositide phospholipase C n=1 Tax=Lipomyces tetrasporus TaxID=54092 RepID=A0AAD7QL89_9ASCO|nr:PLC-like phosphodiesterase [Lipomyces tetrasporus]KAJ8097035.1 PLC-like phosphodiesterase [Lipomyces tetrasporus]